MKDHDFAMTIIVIYVSEIKHPFKRVHNYSFSAFRRYCSAEFSVADACLGFKTRNERICNLYAKAVSQNEP